MKKEKLRKTLIAHISHRDWDRLKAGDPSLYISDFNRKTLLEMEKTEAPDGESLPADLLSSMHSDLSAYLDRYMADHPEAHQWIILSCIYLAGVAGRPMHPQDSAHWESSGGKYYCSYYSDEEGSVCRYCICEKKTEKSEKDHN